jgi:hypothetical protein
MNLLTPADIVRITGFSRPTVMAWLHEADPSKRLRSFRPGGGARIVVAEQDFVEWLKRNETARHGKAQYRATKRRRAGAVAR